MLIDWVKKRKPLYSGTFLFVDFRKYITEHLYHSYATMDTVESRILSQGVRNGTSIYLADDTADQVVAEMSNVASAAHKGGDVAAGGNEEDLLGLIL